MGGWNVSRCSVLGRCASALISAEPRPESIAIDDTGNRTRSDARATPNDSYDAIVACIVRLVRETRGLRPTDGHRRNRNSRRCVASHGLVKNANTGRIDRASAGLRLGVRPGPARAHRQDATLRASEASDGAGASARVVFWRHRGAPARPARGGGRETSDRAARHRGRMGTQSPALASRRRAAGPALLLRKERLHRNLPRWPTLARDHRLHTGEARDANDIAGALKPATRLPWRA